MAEDPTPEDWRKLLRDAVAYDYPEETTKGGWRARRRAKRQHRLAHRQEARKRLADARRREPVTAGAAVVIMVVILGVGWAAQSLKEDSENEEKSVTAPPSPSQESTPERERGEEESERRKAEEETGTPESTAEAWASAYWERNPPEDIDYETVIERSSPYIATPLKENLISYGEDPEWGKLVSRGGVSKVVSVKTGKADSGLGVDAPGRVWRKVTTKTEVEGYKKYTDTHTVIVEVMITGEDTWEITRIRGLGENDE